MRKWKRRTPGCFNTFIQLARAVQSAGAAAGMRLLNRRFLAGRPLTAINFSRLDSQPIPGGYADSHIL